MPLDDLFTLIHELRERIEAHNKPSSHRARPSPATPSSTPCCACSAGTPRTPPSWSPSTSSGSGSADYALLGNGKPLMMVEAKKLGTPLRRCGQAGHRLLSR